MKIIGKTKDGLLAEVTELEAYNIGGVHSQYSNDGLKIEIGQTIKVSEIYSRYKAIEYRQSERKQQAEALRTAAALLENLPSLIDMSMQPIEPEQATS